MRRRIGLMMALLLCFVAAMPVFGADDNRVTTLAEAMAIVEAAVDIPETMTEFEHDSFEMMYEDGTIGLIWSLEWEDEEYDEAIYAYVNDRGVINSYRRYRYEDEERFGRVTREAGREVAEVFLQKALPTEVAAGMRPINEETDRVSSYGLFYTYQYHHEGIPVPALTVLVIVDPYGGYVNTFYGSRLEMSLPVFADQEPKITPEEAAAVYLSQFGLNLQYQSYYDEQARGMVAFPVYMLNEMNQLAIDAVSGELVELHQTGLYPERGSGGGSAYGGSRYSYANSEWAQEEELAALLTRDQALAALIEAAPYFAGQTPEWDDLAEDWSVGGIYTWGFGYEDGAGLVDAATGEILNFYNYDETLFVGNAALSEEKAHQAVEAFLRKVAPEQFPQTTLSAENVDYADRLALLDETADRYTYRYYRQANGIPYPEHSLTVSIAANSGQIYSFRKDWDEEITFRAVEQLISEAEALAILNEAAQLSLIYDFEEGNRASLVYQFTGDVPYLVDASTGEKVTKTGRPYNQPKEFRYEDLEGHWSQEIVQVLLSNGYYLADDQFRPDQVITQREFLQFLYSDWYGYWGADDYDELDADEFYQYLEWMDMVTPAERADEASLSRQEAAKFIVRYLDLELIGKQSGVFINPFTDEIDAEYEGYAVLCKVLGIMQGDHKGAFHGAADMSRAEAASALYQLFQVE